MREMRGLDPLLHEDSEERDWKNFGDVQPLDLFSSFTEG